MLQHVILIATCYLITGGSKLRSPLRAVTKSITMQAQDSAYKSTWRAAPSGTQSGHGTPTLSSKDTSLIEDQKLGKGPADQRLLQEDAIRRSGVSGPLGMGVVMQSECHTAKLPEAGRIMSDNLGLCCSSEDMLNQPIDGHWLRSMLLLQNVPQTLNLKTVHA